MVKPNPSQVPAWSSLTEGVCLVARGVTFRTAIRVALVVGTVLSAINQGGVFMSGDADVLTGVRTLFNYLIPFTVASIGYLAPFRIGRQSAPAKHDL